MKTSGNLTVTVSWFDVAVENQSKFNGGCADASAEQEKHTDLYNRIRNAMEEVLDA